MRKRLFGNGEAINIPGISINHGIFDRDAPRRVHYITNGNIVLVQHGVLAVIEEKNMKEH